MFSRKIFGLPLWLVGVGILVVLLLIGLLVVNAIGSLWAGQGWVDPIVCSESEGCSSTWPLILSALMIFLLLTGFAYTTLLERRLIAFFQQRIGPNRAGPLGFFQPVADGVKLIFKEDIMPAKAFKGLYLIAPILKAVPILIVIAVIPLGPSLTLPWFDGNWYYVPLSVANLNVGVLWILAITSLGTYGVVLAGWSSNNKYAMLGGLRASAQMISYELSLGLALIVPVMLAGTMSVTGIVEAQGGLFVNWFVFQNPLAAAILMIALVAEVNRAPFDLPEAEQELTAGYMTEYSGMKFALFMMAEYLGMIAVSMIAASMFFGGYSSGFGIEDGVPIIGPLVLIGKVVLLLMGFIWLRATLPRIRYDRLMTFGWKVLLPLSLLAVSWSAVAVVISDEFGQTGYIMVSGAMFTVIALVVLFVLYRSGEFQEDEDEDVEDDPMITGERAGIGYNILVFVGALIALPFMLFQGLIGLLEGIAELAEESAPEPVVDESAIEEASASTPTTGGD